MSSEEIANAQNNQNVLVLLLTAVLAIGVMHALGKQKQRPSNISFVPFSWIPYFGATGEYFASIVLFMEKYRTLYGGIFAAKILGRDWYFLHDARDIRKAVKSPEKDASMYGGIVVLAGNLMPTEEVEGRSLPKQILKAISRRRDYSGLASTPLFVHSLKKLPNWTPALREAFQYNFTHKIADKGTMELFQWCWNLISIATARVLLGDDPDMSTIQEWVDIVKNCEIDQALAGSFSESAQSIFEASVLGERRVFARARAFIYPYVDQEIDRFLAGEPETDSVICSLVRAMYRYVKNLENPQEALKMAKLRVANDTIFFTFAAITNSYGAASWSLFHVLRNTSGCGQEVRQELVTANENQLCFASLDRCILEITRLYTPGTFFRLLKTPFQLGSDPTVLIPEGSLVCYGGCEMGRDASIWARNSEKDSVYDFDPGRWTLERRQEQGTDKDLLFLGFGAGAHPCVGKRFALTEISIFVAEALKTFEFELVKPNDSKKANVEAEAMTNRMIRNVPDHPVLDPKQTNGIWRPVDPVYIHYERKQTQE